MTKWTKILIYFINRRGLQNIIERRRLIEWKWCNLNVPRFSCRRHTKIIFLITKATCFGMALTIQPST